MRFYRIHRWQHPRFYCMNSLRYYQQQRPFLSRSLSIQESNTGGLLSWDRSPSERRKFGSFSNLLSPRSLSKALGLGKHQSKRGRHFTERALFRRNSNTDTQFLVLSKTSCRQNQPKRSKPSAPLSSPPLLLQPVKAFAGNNTTSPH